MATIINMSADARDRAGKGAARATRRDGRVPAVIYGDKKDPILVSVAPKELVKELNKEGFFNHLIDLKLGEESHLVLARDVQLDPVTDRPIHVDFLRVGAESTVTVDIPVHFINHERSPGIKRGGMLNVVRHEIEMVCRATDIPESLTVDLNGLNIGDSVHISMIALPEGSKPVISDRDFTVATIVPPLVGETAA